MYLFGIAGVVAPYGPQAPTAETFLRFFEKEAFWSGDSSRSHLTSPNWRSRFTP